MKITKDTRNGHLYITDAEIMRGSFRNFSGEKSGRYDTPGKRYFHFIIEDDEIAEQLNNEGWGVHVLNPRDPQERPTHFLKVQIRLGSPYFRCDCYSVSRDVKTLLTDETLRTLDGADIDFADLDIRPYEYEDGHISAQLEEGFFNVRASHFADRYSDDRFQRPSDDIPF